MVVLRRLAAAALVGLVAVAAEEEQYPYASGSSGYGAPSGYGAAPANNYGAQPANGYGAPTWKNTQWDQGKVHTAWNTAPDSRVWDALRPVNTKFSEPAERELEFEFPLMTPCSPVPGAPNTGCGRESFAQAFTMYCMKQSEDLALLVRPFCASLGGAAPTATPAPAWQHPWGQQASSQKWDEKKDGGVYGHPNWSWRKGVSYNPSNINSEVASRTANIQQIKCEDAFFKRVIDFTTACLTESWVRVKYIEKYARYHHKNPYLWYNMLQHDINTAYKCNKSDCFKGYCNPRTDPLLANFPENSPYSNPTINEFFPNAAALWQPTTTNEGPGYANKGRWFYWGYGLYGFCLLQTCEKCMAHPSSAQAEYTPPVCAEGPTVNEDFLLNYLAAKKCNMKLAEKGKITINLDKVPIPGFFAGTQAANTALLNTLATDSCEGVEVLGAEITTAASEETQAFCAEVSDVDMTVQEICDKAAEENICDCQTERNKLWLKNLNSEPQWMKDHQAAGSGAYEMQAGYDYGYASPHDWVPSDKPSGKPSMKPAAH